MGANDHVETKKRGKRAAQSSVVGESYDAEFRGYINLDLTDDQKASWAKWAGSPDEAAWLESSVSDGVNLSLRIDPRSGGFLASATQRRVGSPNAGLCVTARAREAVSALSRVVYCLAILGEKERWEDTQPLANPDRW